MHIRCCIYQLIQVYFHVHADDSVFTDEQPVKLTTFQQIPESIIEEADSDSQHEMNLKDDDTEFHNSTPEKFETTTFNKANTDDDDAASIKDEEVENMENSSSILPEIKPAVLPCTKKSIIDICYLWFQHIIVICLNCSV